MPRREDWTREQLIIALKLYCEVPFGKMHSKNPQIIRYAALIHRTPSALAMKLTNFASLDPVITSSGRKGLTGASRADRAIWKEMTSDWPKLAKSVVRIESTLREPRSEIDEPKYDKETYVGRTKEAVVQTRVGQSLFRNAVLSAYEFKCCITGLSIPDLLIASHIVPWKDDQTNRLNPRNGLSLSAIHDRAFDLGFITISSDLRVLLSTKLRKLKADDYINSTFCAYEGQSITPPTKFSPDTGFLQYHRERIFHP